MPKYAALVRKPSSPFLAHEGHAVSELLLSGWAYLCPRGDGSDLSLAFVPALGSPALEVEGCLPGGLAPQHLRDR